MHRATVRDFKEQPYVDLLVAGLPRGSRVLDVGCGCGVPIDRYLLGLGYAVTGVDISRRMLALASDEAAGTTLLQGDMRSVDLQGSFAALVAWDVLFHIPRREHVAMFRRFRRWLSPGGRLLVTLGGSEGDFHAPMLGATLFYSSHHPDRSVAMLTGAGFRLALREVDDPSSRGHLVLLASSTQLGIR